jgi:hypothetical protein
MRKTVKKSANSPDRSKSKTPTTKFEIETGSSTKTANNTKYYSLYRNFGINKNNADDTKQRSKLDEQNQQDYKVPLKSGRKINTASKIRITRDQSSMRKVNKSYDLSFSNKVDLE